MGLIDKYAEKIDHVLEEIVALFEEVNRREHTAQDESNFGTNSKAMDDYIWGKRNHW